MISDQYIISVELLKEKIKDNKSYPFSLPVVSHFKKIEFDKFITFLVGENGTGKSTLLEAIAVQYGFNGEGGSKNFNFKTRQTHSILSEFIRITKGIKKPKDNYFLRAESFYNVASNIDDIGVTGYGEKSLHEQSHGESFFSLFLNRLRGEGIYLFDEPEAALSPQRQLALIARINELIKKDSQFIIATHSPILLSYPKAKIIQITEQGFENVSYKETECYDFYKTFINNPENILRRMDIK
ncbi:MAG: AAA family ATPase [Candidatus Pacebacteria bacterium]|nr:AAA family ATPase [Candidatus Paceibacterota bacterium]